MKILSLLICVGKALVGQIGNLAGFDVPGQVVANVCEKIWQEWKRQKSAQERREEMVAIVQMAAEEFRLQVAEVVREFAMNQPEDVRKDVTDCLQRIPDLARQSFQRPEDPEGRSVPAGWHARQASDLLPLVSFPTKASNAVVDRSKVGQTPPSGSRVALQFIQGPWTGREDLCTEPTVFLFGRGGRCEPKFPQENHNLISRHHCLLEINPPDVRLRDLGSLHGTLVNGNLIGKRPKNTAPLPGFESQEHDLKDGDVVQLTQQGQVAFFVRVMVPVRCGGCGVVIADADKAASAQEVGGYLCPACRESGTKEYRPTCTWCQREVTAQPGANRPGGFVCPDCRHNAKSIMQGLAVEAKKDSGPLRVIRDFTLLGELGHGGMGAVYLARHVQTGQQVAVKLILPQVAADEHAVSMFQREIRNGKALGHRHVVRFLDDGYARGIFFMVLEYCDGGSVNKLMQRRPGGILAVDEAVEIILQALEGLEYAHQADIPFVKQKRGFGPGKGLVHRDLKPANLFLSGQGSGRVTKLGDFGLAKAFEEAGLSGGTRTGNVAGTWQYMCRQQVISYKRVGPEVDVWALAATLYAMLTGHVPRDFSKKQDPWITVLETDAVPIRNRNPSIPEKLAGVIDHALREEPAIGFQTAKQLKDAIEVAM